jgi:putative membrane protein
MLKTIASGGALIALAAALCVPPAARASDTGAERRHTKLANPAADMMSETQIVGMLQAVDQSETEAAQIALERSKNEDVLSFARQMIVDHGEAARKLGEVGIQGTSSEGSRKLKERSKTASRRFTRLEGPAFDRAYMAAQVEDHAMVLDKIDRKFAPAAKSGMLVTHLQERRPVIESHLEHARRIRTSLGTK